ncbi:hypothetical protein GCM10022236_51690 [Microlunatus ginsengisoli]|uniref:Uncharacterized protein n=1 Tax=Microlunatus ginsengisoli TaxID=363863 RepID=A0ABP7AYQ1_9ACTN
MFWKETDTGHNNLGADPLARPADVQCDPASARVPADLVVLGDPKDDLIVSQRIADNHNAWPAPGLVAQTSPALLTEPETAFGRR